MERAENSPTGLDLHDMLAAVPRAIAVSMLLVSLVVAACPRADSQHVPEPANEPRDQAEQQRRAISATVAGYVDALGARDAAAAGSWVTSATFEFYDQLRLLALTSERSELEQRSMMEIVMVLELRSRFTRAELEQTRGRALFDDAITAGMPAEPLPLDDVWIDEAAGRAEVRIEGQAVLWLAREQGRWCVDLPAAILGLTPMIEAELADAILADGKLRVAFTLLEVEREGVHGLVLEILDGPLDALP
jgi:hypothetical protein